VFTNFDPTGRTDCNVPAFPAAGEKDVGLLCAETALVVRPQIVLVLRYTSCPPALQALTSCAPSRSGPTRAKHLLAVSLLQAPSAHSTQRKGAHHLDCVQSRDWQEMTARVTLTAAPGPLSRPRLPKPRAKRCRVSLNIPALNRIGTQHLPARRHTTSSVAHIDLSGFDLLANCGVLLTARKCSPRAHCSLHNRPHCALHAGCASERIRARSRSRLLPTLTLQVTGRAD